MIQILNHPAFNQTDDDIILFWQWVIYVDIS